MHSPDLSQQNIEKLKELFPNCVTESKDENGKPISSIDFDLLKQELSDHVVEDPQERYRIDWPGKHQAMFIANAPIAKTLRPVRKESVDFDTTKNLFIEGDNLAALKLLQETYLNKVKMIYIDPPYNTGKDFIFKDDYAEDLATYLERSNQVDNEGNRLVANAETNGRFHSDWLSMMYPRLKLARNLLRDDGVIFISIDDNEQANLKRLCDEVFGEKNFLGCFIWKRRSSSALENYNFSSDHDYVLTYQKGKFKGFLGVKKDYNNYSNPDNDERGPWTLGDLTVGMTAAMRPNQAYDIVDPKTGITYSFNPNRVWAYYPPSMKKLIDENRVYFPKDNKKRPMLKRFKNELRNDHNPIPSILIEYVGLNSEGTRKIQELFNFNVFDYTKPISLIEFLAKQCLCQNDTILDFFTGSGTTAHAVMNLNAHDDGKRQCISIQLPELTDEKKEAYKAGYTNIAEISKERIRRAGKKIKEENLDADIDIGFRVLKVDTSNMEDVYYLPDDTEQADLLTRVNNIKPDRTAEDLLFQVLLDWGVDLTLPIVKREISGKTVYFVDENALVACFDEGIDETFIHEVAEIKPLRVVFRNSGFTSDAVKINVTQIFKLMSPDTDIRTI